ncbi:hypothetical protein AB3N02_22725 [Priestia aryabhattai]|uniref:hypothetical protein n=1 Tax=Priestia aryabhattai TaxID=412384 RepID=UPI0039A12617
MALGSVQLTSKEVGIALLDYVSRKYGVTAVSSHIYSDESAYVNFILKAVDESGEDDE